MKFFDYTSYRAFDFNGNFICLHICYSLIKFDPFSFLYQINISLLLTNYATVPSLIESAKNGRLTVFTSLFQLLPANEYFRQLVKSEVLNIRFPIFRDEQIEKRFEYKGIDVDIFPMFVSLFIILKLIIKGSYLFKMFNNF